MSTPAHRPSSMPAHRRQETYKHLDDPLRPGGLTLGQWGTLVGSAVAAIVFGLYVSPLPAGPTISLSLFFAGLPAALSYAAGGFDLSIADSTRAVWRWAHGEKHYLPGPGAVAAGYVVVAPLEETPTRGREDVFRQRRGLEGAWDS
jgi:hypothetical protein